MGCENCRHIRAYTIFVLLDENKLYVLWRFKLFQTYLDFTDLINKLDREIVIHDWFFWHDFYTNKKKSCYFIGKVFLSL